MTEPASDLSEARAAKVLHLAFTGGLLILAVVAFLVSRMLGPLLRAERSQILVAGICTTVAVLILGAAILFVRRRLPAPGPGSSGAAYWTPETRGRVLIFWVLTESAGLWGFTGHLLTARLAPAALGVLGLAALLWHAPGRIAGE